MKSNKPIKEYIWRCYSRQRSSWQKSPCSKTALLNAIKNIYPGNDISLRDKKEVNALDGESAIEYEVDIYVGMLGFTETWWIS